MEFIDLKAQYARLEGKIQTRINKVLVEGNYILGPEVKELEEALAAYVGAKHCICVANGTDALQLALRAMRIGPGDAVFVPSFTFFASAEVIALVGAVPVFVDIDKDTYNICPQSLENEIKRVRAEGKLNLRAIISVDLYGLPADYPVIQKIADTYNLMLIEDGAQGFGGLIGSRKACSFGDVATTSFFPAKPLGCYGDGGAIFTSDDDLAQLLASLRVHGKGADKYDNVRIGLNSRLDTIQATILLEKLAVFPEEVALREKVACRYSAAFSEEFVVPTIPDGFSSVWAQYTLRVKHSTRESMQKVLKDNGIPSAVYYPKGLHQQKAFAYLENNCSKLPVTEEIQGDVFSLPMHPYLSEEDQDKIIETLNQNSRVS